MGSVCDSCGGRVDCICYINSDEVSFEVSYCGCCENNEEELSVDLLLMEDEDVKVLFTKEQKERVEENLRRKEEKEDKEKLELEEYEKQEYERLNKKFTNKVNVVESKQ